MATKNTKLTATMPCGTLVTRTTARTYTHVVVACDDLAVLRADAGKSTDVDRKRYARLTKQVTLGVGGTYTVNDYGVRPFTVTIDQSDYDDAVKALAGCETFDAYAAMVIAGRLARHDEKYGDAPTSAWGVVGWCGRPDLAEKAASKHRALFGVHSVQIVPVNA